MSKFFGPIGFVIDEETEPGSGIWVQVPTERNYRGEVNRISKRWDSSEHLNKNLNISNTISIVADPFVSNNLNAIRYIKWLGGYWEITSVDVELPRLTLSIGGAYNGPKAGTSESSNEYPRIS